MGDTLKKLRDRPFTAALVAFGAALVVAPSVRLGDFGGTIYYVALILAVYGATDRGWVRRSSMIYALTAALVHITNHAAGNPLSAPVVFVFDLAFSAFTPIIVIRYVLSRKVVLNDDLAGALVSYVLIGVFFGFTAAVIEGFAPGSYTGPGVQSHFGEIGEFAYFSFVTLTTLGYGDIVPASPGAKGLAVLEAIIGQGYLAVLIAHLVGRRTAPQANEAG